MFSLLEILLLRGSMKEIILFDIFSQIYDESGTPVGSNIKIRDDENSLYYITPPSCDVDSAVSLMIAWNEKHTGNYQIFTQNLTRREIALALRFR